MTPLIRKEASAVSDFESKTENNISKIKCVLVGDGAVGKTSLIVSYTTNGYPTEYVPTAFDNYSAVVTVDNQPIRLQLCDTAGQDDFDSLRPLCYLNTNVFLLCFSVVCPTSFYNIKEKWLPEIRRHCPTAPVLLVGTQCDLRTDVKVLIELAHYQEQPVTEQEARKLSQWMRSVGYIECSSLTQKNLKEVFDTAILTALQNIRPDSTNTSWISTKDNSVFSKFAYSDSLNVPWQTRDVFSVKSKNRKKNWWKKLCCFLK
ncbi:cell division control protein 42 homolog [Limulus polyphemus]|uniref:Cell division control protein 42 homolog n=1 Tax=Limulus polyphemus TaxID=6850 RepID=A0ABM1BBM0_LIMPO|nr:cell division control protein 42 homolog [Limulus polyphemus]